MGHDLLFDGFARSGGTLKMQSVSYGPAMYEIEIVMSVLLLMSVSEH